MGIDFRDNLLSLTARSSDGVQAPTTHVKKMSLPHLRCSPLIARYGRRRFRSPAMRCGVRARSSSHRGIRKLGARFEMEGEHFIGESGVACMERAHSFDVSSVGATGTLMMAASLRRGSDPDRKTRDNGTPESAALPVSDRHGGPDPTGWERIGRRDKGCRTNSHTGLRHDTGPMRQEHSSSRSKVHWWERDTRACGSRKISPRSLQAGRRRARFAAVAGSLSLTASPAHCALSTSRRPYTPGSRRTCSTVGHL